MLKIFVYEVGRYTNYICFCLLLLISFPVYAKDTLQSKYTENDVYLGIKSTLENNLYQLPPRLQGHYGIRRYRVSGEEKYAMSALVDLIVVTESQAFYACNIEKKALLKMKLRKRF